MKKGKVKSSNFSKSIPFNYQNHLIIVKAEIAGKERRFLFDSGAPNVISKELQEELQYKVQISNGVKDGQGLRTVLDFVYIDEIIIGDIAFQKSIAAVADLNTSEEIKCLNIDGIIGSNLMAKLNWEIDYENRILTFTDSKKLKSQDKAEIKINFDSDFQKTPNISMGLGSKVQNFITFDLGSSGGIHIKDSDLESSFKQISSYGWIHSSLYGSGFDTAYYRYTNPLLLGNVSLGPYWVKCSKKSSRTIGNRVWENFKVQLNYSDEVIYLHKTQDITPSMKDFGFNMKLEEGQWIISSIVMESQAFDYGLRPGFLVLEINGINLSDAGWDDYCMHFLNGSLIPDEDDLSIKVITSENEELEMQLIREEFFSF